MTLRFPLASHTSRFGLQSSPNFNLQARSFLGPASIATPSRLNATAHRSVSPILIPTSIYSASPPHQHIYPWKYVAPLPSRHANYTCNAIFRRGSSGHRRRGIMYQCKDLLRLASFIPGEILRSQILLSYVEMRYLQNKCLPQTVLKMRCFQYFPGFSRYKVDVFPQMLSVHMPCFFP